MAKAKLKHVTVVVIFTINSCLIITDNFYISATGLPTLHSYSVSRTRVFQKTDKNNLKGKTLNNGKVKNQSLFSVYVLILIPSNYVIILRLFKISLTCR